MAVTPAHIAVARGPRAHQLSPQELIRMRELYLEKRYKQCIAACEELLEPPPSTPLTPTFASKAELHPVHKAFLIFHQAISYECMGLAAHKYSQNKLRFLESAKEKFEAAVNVLPQPFANAEDGQYHTPHVDSPDLRYSADDASHHGDDSLFTDADMSGDEVDSPSLDGSFSPNFVAASEHFPSDDSPQQNRIASETPSMQVSHRTRSPSEESFGSNTTATTVLQAYTVPDFDKYSPRQDLVGQDTHLPQIETPLPSNSRRMLPRSVPLVKIDSADFDSSDDESEPEHAQSRWLPRSMRSLNLAAHDLSSEDDSDHEEATPSRQPVLGAWNNKKELGVMPPSKQTPITAAMGSLRRRAILSPSHTFRLSASLSSKHVLDQNLVPSPLFSKAKKIVMVGFEEDEDSKPAPRPLPRTPHSFHSHLNLLPARKTAVQTLICKFEGALPSPHTPSSYTTVTPIGSNSSQLTFRTPATLRFDMIHDAFDAHSPDRKHLTAYLTSRSLANYNSKLASFRTCLVTASEQTSDLLDAAERTQQQHEEGKRAAALRDQADGLPKNRLASMWLLSTPGKPASDANKSRSSSRNQKQEQIASPTPTPRAKMLGRSESLRSRKKLPLRNRVEESEEKRVQRIQKLRVCGFKVTKEAYGWKGDEYYEGFRRNVEIELGA